MKKHTNVNNIGVLINNVDDFLDNIGPSLDKLFRDRLSEELII